MIQITQLKLPYGHTEAELSEKIRKTLHLSTKERFTYRITKKSIDARKKPQLFLVYTVMVSCAQEQKQVKIAQNASVSMAKEVIYHLPESGNEKLSHPPLVIGAGPAGLFAAYLLVEAGFRPILIERGKPVEERTLDVIQFWKTGVLDISSNVQFGEGGAGTFSDGKLNTVVKDPSGRNQFVLNTFVRFGAPSEILYENKPHIGTDILCEVIRNLRTYLIENGASIHFETCATDFVIEDHAIRKVVTNRETFEVSAVILAPGHSARDTFERLYTLGVPMEQKNFAVGFRVEHPQEMINLALYGRQEQKMPASPYKVTANFENGRGVYSFCMCPGGVVVNASSEEGHLVVNGMSYSKRDSSTANSAIIVSVGAADFGSTDPLASMYYQRKLEEKAYTLANGRIPQQLYGDFCTNRTSTSYGDFASNTKGGTELSNLRGLFSSEMEESFIAGMKQFAKIIPDFDRYDAILSGVESRTSSPLRILRNETNESLICGLYPCGEGAGYAGGITSAAMDGIRVAEAIIRRYEPNH